ncbi:MAG: MarR family transcriptional regulator [Sphingosinicella sp.]|nr:MarR family transcriptional regulator [Sphingosinicella sp.]
MIDGRLLVEITNQADKAPALQAIGSRLLGQTALLVGRATGEALTGAGSHRHQYAVLATLDAFGASSQAELCRRTDLDRSDMNMVINALETEGAVTRKTDPDNRRQNVVELTRKGRTLYALLSERLTKAHDRALAPLAAKERTELFRLLRKLHDHLAPIS